MSRSIIYSINQRISSGRGCTTEFTGKYDVFGVPLSYNGSVNYCITTHKINGFVPVNKMQQCVRVIDRVETYQDIDFFF